MSLNQVGNIERNVSSRSKPSDPHLSMIYRLAQALDVPPALLLPDLERPPRSLSADTQRSRVENELAEAMKRLEGPPR